MTPDQESRLRGESVKDKIDPDISAAMSEIDKLRNELNYAFQAGSEAMQRKIIQYHRDCSDEHFATAGRLLDIIHRQDSPADMCAAAWSLRTEEMNLAFWHGVTAIKITDMIPAVPELSR